MTAYTTRENPSAILYPVTANRKLAPVEMQANTTARLRPVPVGPFVSSTYVSLQATCPSSCSFRQNGCYVTSGFYAPIAKMLDANAANRTGYGVIEEEALTIEQFARAKHGRKEKRRRGVPQDGGKHGTTGRDLRLHVGGDVPDEMAAARLAKAAIIWRMYQGGKVWTYTHNWRDIPRSTFGEISVLASVETVAEIAQARRRGYAPAIVVSHFKSEKAWAVGGNTYIPCPAETRGTSCVKCRLCLDADALKKRNAVIAFAAHGLHSNKIRDALDTKKVRRLTVVS